MNSLKRLLACILATLLLANVAFSENVRTLLMEDVSRAGVNHFVYPVELIGERTEAPKGYTPFYISHYGRHGSRSDIDDGKSWKKLSGRLHQLDSMQLLTEAGREIMVEVDSIYSLQMGKFSLLTEVGVQQHRGIASRMYSSFPEVFRDGAKVSATSSSSRRCVASMKAFLSALSECNSSLELTSDSSKAVQGVCRPSSSKYNPLFSRDDSEAFKHYVSSHDNERYRILKSWWVEDNSCTEKITKDSYASMKAIGTKSSKFGYEVLRALDFGQNVGREEDELIRKVFTEDEIYRFYLKRNYDLLSKYFLIQSPERAKFAYAMKYLVDDMIGKADDVISGQRTECADLRFGHDTYVLGLLSVLSFDSIPMDFVSIEDLGTRIHGFKVIPMAANVQMVFYRNKKNVLVKFLLNENEMTLPIKSYRGPYYRWNDVKKYINARYAAIKAQVDGKKS